MKSYVKVIEAEQFNGDVASLKEFVGAENEIIETDGKIILVTKTDKWNVVPTDYVAKGYYGLLVFKQERFEKEFDEVVVEDIDNTPVAVAKPIEAEPVTKNVFPVEEVKEQLEKVKAGKKKVETEK
ncbi:hypothetical protein BOX09_gp02 [Flavobacterium phage Fpv1]|uniref:Uncharacterized protein n=4 Tax=Fipvunavirus TaxID=2560132 RepID=A0A1B0WLL3_9CAUD|nr:hypothetical protein BOW80_gp01 [Flavobacterium phage Fpv3]YP_009321871.1 hypothetical protein BOW81_gp02 [Flavobacterium phage Fpv20]YP_009322004.1 hypothetical protein BOX09_gp02 [Flavobacterium phage Fpv1]YP_009323593.1 hypothetical protein BOW82_gp02 [Flavobacterium phage Fpv2]YP_009594057.1 hypothetical protein FDG89_gp01 [Flavobacterium phage FpV4]ALN97248.1 hypothetical protein [Flavobacterium phage FpV21]QCW20254.1 hypothetical protein [Flavobacterium phage FPSV-F12]QCW20659.1 hyp